MVSRLGLRKVMAVIATGAAFAMIAPTMAVAQQTTPGDTTVVADDAAERTTWSWVDDFTSFAAAEGANATWHAQWKGGSGEWNDFDSDNAKLEGEGFRYWFVHGNKSNPPASSGPVGYETVGGVKRGVVSVGDNSVDGAVTWKAPKAGTVWLTLASGEPYRAAASNQTIAFGVQLRRGESDLLLKSSTLTDTTPAAGWDSPLPITVQAGDYVRIFAESNSNITDGRVYASPTITYTSPDSYSMVDEFAQTFIQNTTGTWTAERQTGDNTWAALTVRGAANNANQPSASLYYNTWYGTGINVRVGSLPASNRNTLTGIINDDVSDPTKGAALTWTAPKAGKVTVGVRNDEPYRLSASHTGSLTLQLKKNDEAAVCTATLAAGSTARSADFASCLESSKGVIDVVAGDKIRIISTAANNTDHGDLVVSPVISYLTENTSDNTYSAKVANVTNYRGDKPANTAGSTAASFTAPAAPEGYAFAGWYTDGTLTTPLATTAKTGTAYAKFVKAYSDASAGETDGIIQFQGGSLRADYKDSTGSADYTKTSLRFGYHVVVPTGATYTNTESGWKLGLSETNLPVNQISNKFITTDGVVTTNLVVTNIDQTKYDTSFYAKPYVTYTTQDGTKVTAYGDVSHRSVKEIAVKIQSSDSATQDEKTYAAGILSAIETTK